MVTVNSCPSLPGNLIDLQNSTVGVVRAPDGFSSQPTQ
jgi:hypothetical protein